MNYLIPGIQGKGVERGAMNLKCVETFLEHEGMTTSTMMPSQSTEYNYFEKNPIKGGIRLFIYIKLLRASCLGLLGLSTE